MEALMFLSMFDSQSMKILWLLDIAMLIIICTNTLISNRKPNDTENFNRNFKIGFYRCMGGMCAIFFVYSMIATVIYAIVK